MCTVNKGKGQSVYIMNDLSFFFWREGGMGSRLGQTTATVWA